MSDPSKVRSAWILAISRLWAAKVYILLGIFAVLIFYLDPWIPIEGKRWVYLGFFAAALLTAWGAFLARIMYRFIYRFLRRANPVLVAIILCVTTLTYLVLRPWGPQTVTVKFDHASGWLYSAWDDVHLQGASQIRVFGIAPNMSLSREWGISDEDTAYFTFEVDPNLGNEYPALSSGGYMTFYETPLRDLRKYRQLTFSAKVSDPQDCASPDFGVRLEWDPSNGVAFEMPSLLNYKKGGTNLGVSWQNYAIDLDSLTERTTSPSPGIGMNRHAVNKVAFFVASQNVSGCRRATLWFRDVRLEPPRLR